jgi:hypothetical protein
VLVPQSKTLTARIRRQSPLCVIADHALSAAEQRDMGTACYSMNAVQCESFPDGDKVPLLRILVQSAKMRSGYLILNCIFSWSKFIALVAALFLLSANLDNVPDCPELLNSSSGPSVSLQLVHHDMVARPDIIGVAWENFRPSAASTPYISDALLALSPSWAPQSLDQAADPSPPSC